MSTLAQIQLGVLLGLCTAAWALLVALLWLNLDHRLRQAQWREWLSSGIVLWLLLGLLLFLQAPFGATPLLWGTLAWLLSGLLLFFEEGWEAVAWWTRFTCTLPPGHVATKPGSAGSGILLLCPHFFMAVASSCALAVWSVLGSHVLFARGTLAVVAWTRKQENPCGVFCWVLMKDSAASSAHWSIRDCELVLALEDGVPCKAPFPSYHRVMAQMWTRAALRVGSGDDRVMAMSLAVYHGTMVPGGVGVRGTLGHLGHYVIRRLAWSKGDVSEMFRRGYALAALAGRNLVGLSMFYVQHGLEGERGLKEWIVYQHTASARRSFLFVRHKPRHRRAPQPAQDPIARTG